MKAKCSYCGKSFEILTGHYNRAMALGYGVYCSRNHSGLAKRVKRSKKEKKEIKRLYDLEYRVRMADKIKKDKAEYFKRDYADNPKKYERWRRNRKEWHNEYCRHPEYKEWKKAYDREYRAKKNYGPIADIFLVWLDLRNGIDNRFAKKQNNIQNKSQKRKRLCQTQLPKERLNSLL
jgi:hypothetical protein